MKLIQRLSRFRPLAPLLGCALLGAFHFSVSAAPPQSARPRENLHNVLSRHLLTPPFRERALLRFSPDGKFLLLQDSSGVYILSREPLKVIGYISAQDIYGAIFSSDSQFIRLVGTGLVVSSWRLPDFQKMPDIALPLKEGCLDTDLAVNAQNLACFRTNETLQIYNLATGEEVYTDVFSLNANPITRNLMRHLLSLNGDTPYAGPLGFVSVDSWAPFVVRRLAYFPLFFSPNGQDLFLVYYGIGYHVDLTAKKKMSCRGTLSKHPRNVLAHLDAGRLVAIDQENRSALQIFSVDSGAPVASVPLDSNSVRPASNSRFLLWRKPGSPADFIFDLQENRSIEPPLNIGLDIFGNDLAVYTAEGNLFLYHLGEPLPYRTTKMPLSGITKLNVVSVDSSLQRLAFSVNYDIGVVFQIENGNQIASLSPFNAAFFTDAASGWFSFPAIKPSPARFEKMDTATGQLSSSFPSSAGNEFSRPGGSVLIEYSLDDSTGRGMSGLNREGGVAYRLRALDPATGKEIWKHAFQREIPIPFPDPQGDRLVFGWKAKDDDAHEIAKHLPAAKEMYKNAKLKDQDSFFEVQDARTRKSLAGVLVQSGSGPHSFDLAFSAGDSLILMKDERRISLYSLQDCALRAHLVGEKPAANAAANLLALDSGAGRLALYDLHTGAKLDDQLFPDDIAYMQFSSDGKRLLVMTAQQIVYVLGTEHPTTVQDSK